MHAPFDRDWNWKLFYKTILKFEGLAMLITIHAKVIWQVKAYSLVNQVKITFIIKVMLNFENFRRLSK